MLQALGKAIAQLEDVLSIDQVGEDDYLRDAAIRRFGVTMELFLRMLQNILAYEKIETTTPRDTLSKAFQYNFIDDEDVWLSMLDDRNNTSHAYKEELARMIFINIKEYIVFLKTTYEQIKTKYQIIPRQDHPL